MWGSCQFPKSGWAMKRLCGSSAAAWFLGLASTSARPAHSLATAPVALTPKLCKDMGKGWAIKSHQELAVLSWASFSGVSLTLISVHRKKPSCHYTTSVSCNFLSYCIHCIHLLYGTHFDTVTDTDFNVLRHRWNSEVDTHSYACHQVHLQLVLLF